MNETLIIKETGSLIIKEGGSLIIKESSNYIFIAAGATFVALAVVGTIIGIMIKRNKTNNNYQKVYKGKYPR